MSKRFKYLINLSLWAFIFGYLIAHAYLYFYQNKLLYFPEQDEGNIEKSWVEVYTNNTFLGYELVRKKSNKTIVIFHGNGGSAQSRTKYSKILPVNYNIFLAEYPGYGRNIQEEISMDSIFERSRLIMNYVIIHETIPHNYKANTVVLGESLGSGVASKMAEEFEVKKLMLVIPYDSILNAAKMRYPWLWIEPILKNNYDNIAFLKNYTGNVLMAVAEKDDILDPSLAFNLFNSLHGHKEEIIIKNAHHLDCYNYLSPIDIKKINQFLS